MNIKKLAKNQIQIMPKYVSEVCLRHQTVSSAPAPPGTSRTASSCSPWTATAPWSSAGSTAGQPEIMCKLWDLLVAF